jgi:hypothetical protein
MAAAETDGVEPMAAPAAAWRTMDCGGCGERPDELSALDAIAFSSFLRRRCVSLLAHPTESLRRRGPKPGSWSALEPAVQVSSVVAATTDHLRELLSEATMPEATMTDVGAATDAAGSLAATLAANFRRLIAAIDAATTRDWYRPRPDNGATAGETVWLALHEATHHIEDAELVLAAGTARNQAAQRQPDPSEPC